MKRVILCSLLVGVFTLSPAAAQGPDTLLHVRISGPVGMRVTFYRGTAKGQTLPAPFVVGLRPGYAYRVQVSGLPQYPGVSFFPTLEVRGALKMMRCLRAADFPAPLVLPVEDFRSVAAGALVTRVVVLEPPETAIPVATRPEQALEIDVPSDRDPVTEADDRGRILLIVRLGQRQVNTEDMISQGISGTVLLPGEKVLPPPRVYPTLPWSCLPVGDPLVGPRNPAEEMCFHDGGDLGLPAGFDREGRLRGVDPADTVAEYSDSKGRRRIAISNRVCLCVPRYVVLRGERATVSQHALIGTGDAYATQAQSQIHAAVLPLEQHTTTQVAGLVSRQQLSGVVQTLGALVVGRVEGLHTYTALVGTGDVTSTCVKPEPPEPPDKPLLLIKEPDKCGGQIGDIITFTLKYRNQGKQPITDVAVSDSLTARLEYVAGSAQSDRAAVFTTQPNEAGSLMLRWEITEPLPPGESGTVRFQVRIR